jgi:nicotinamidase-related amidase
MVAKNTKKSSLDGSVPDRSEVALLVIDVINDLEFEHGDHLLKFALPMATELAALKGDFRDKGLPIIYANDNFGKWKSDFRVQVDHCLNDGVRGQPIVELLQPGEEDYFVLKPKHSAFYATTLDVLLEHLQVRRLVITGMAADICVLFSANDAYMREFEIAIPSDCVASNTQERTHAALTLMERVLKADIRPRTALSF